MRSVGETGQLATKGQPLDSTVEIVNESGQALPPGSTGFVRVSNPYLAKAYLDNPTATVVSFCKGAFFTGDLGCIGPRDEMQILGRTGDILNLGGIKVNAAERDQALRALPEVADAMNFDLPVPGKANA